MKTMIRSLVLSGLFTLSSALFAGSINLSSSGSVIEVHVWGTTAYDSRVNLIDANTNQVVADMIIYSADTNNWLNSGDSQISGLTISFGSNAAFEGVPQGDYRIETVQSMPWNWDTGGSGSYGYGHIIDFEYNYPNDQMDYSFYNTGGSFY
jgi:hypothetical protein